MVYKKSNSISIKKKDSIKNPFVESGGFEPPVRFDPYDSLANCWFKPLTQLSNYALKHVLFSLKALQI